MIKWTLRVWITSAAKHCIMRKFWKAMENYGEQISVCSEGVCYSLQLQLFYDVASSFHNFLSVNNRYGYIDDEIRRHWLFYTCC
jgi:hypothetical protein